MGYERNYDNDKERGEDGRKPGEPHPDADRNLNYALVKIQGFEVCATMDIKFYYYDPRTNQITEPKYVAFYWKDAENRFGNNISFHQSSVKFSEQLDKSIEWYLSKKFLKKNNPGAFR